MKGLSELRQRTPLTRSILLTGPQGVGKTFLVHAICNQLGATLFDLSCTSLMGRYPAKAGMGMLIHLITKVNYFFKSWRKKTFHFPFMHTTDILLRL